MKVTSNIYLLHFLYLFMFEAKRPLAINISNLHKMQASPASTQRDYSPGMTLRRRRTKVEKLIKTNEQLICESHEMLMNYVDNLDEQVKNLLENHQAQFMVAYRTHSTKVKEQMKQIQKHMLENAHNQQQFLDKIKFLEKELIIFRQETMKMSQKLISKNKDIQSLNVKLNELQAENKQQKLSIIKLIKTSMTLSARVQQNDNSTNNQSNVIGQKSTINKSRNEQFNSLDKASPLSLHLKSFTAQMRARSIQKKEKLAASKLISKIEDKQYETIAPSSIQAENSGQKIETSKTDLSNDRKKSTLKSKFERSIVIQSEIQKLRSKSLAQRNEYEKIFVDCVQEVRKNIMRKDFAGSLNFFKQNGPKSLIEFKKIDFFFLLQQFFKNQSIIKKLYQLIFESKSK